MEMYGRWGAKCAVFINQNDHSAAMAVMVITFTFPLTVIAVNVGFSFNPLIILWMRPANERRRYNVMLSLISWAHAQNDPWFVDCDFLKWGIYVHLIVRSATSI